MGTESMGTESMGTESMGAESVGEGPAFTGATPALHSVAATSTPAPSPQAAARLVRELQDPYQRGVALERRLLLLRDHHQESAEMVRELGPDLLAEILAAHDPTPTGGRASSMHDLNRSTAILAAAYDAFGAGELATLFTAIGGKTLAALSEYTLLAAGHPRMPGSQYLVGRLGLFALALGRVARAYGPAHPALSPLLEELMSQPTHEFVNGDQSRVQMAGWLVARCGSEGLKRWFIDQYLPYFDARAPQAPDVARALAMVVGALASPGPVLARMAAWRPQLCRDFWANLLSPGRDALAYTGNIADFGIHRDIHQDVVRFVEQVAVTEEQADSKHSISLCAFSHLVAALDNPLWRCEEPMRLAVARIFRAQPGALIRALSQMGSGFISTPTSVGGDLMVEFLNLVTLRQGDRGCRLTIVAMQEFLGIGGQRYGALDRLTDNACAARDGLLRAGHEVLASDVGFLLGAIRRAARRAIETIPGHDEREHALSRILAGLCEELIQTSSAAEAYAALRQGNARQAEAHTVFRWLSETFCYGEIRHDGPGLCALTDAVLAGPWHPLLVGEGLVGVPPHVRRELQAALQEGMVRSGGPRANLRLVC